MTKAPMFQMSENARFILQRLRDAQPGEVITYAELSQIISLPVTGSSQALARAKLRALRDYDMVFGAVHKVGVKRLTDAEIVADSTSRESRMRSLAAGAIERLCKADYEALSPENKSLLVARQAGFAVIRQFTKADTTKAIMAAATGRREIPLMDTLSMFKKRQEAKA